MNRERAKELLPIIQAFAEGKEVQYYSTNNDKWIDVTNAVFDGSARFRLKPEPKYVWINVYGEGVGCNYYSKQEAELYLSLIHI